jgi:heptosyltransferase-2
LSEPILVIGPSWVGDMVMAQSLYITLKENSEAALDVVAPSWSLPLLSRMPQVREGIELPVTHGELGWNARRDLGRALRRKAYGRAIVVPRSFKSALVPWHARIPVRTGYRGEMRYGLLNDIRPLDEELLTRTVQRFVALGYPPGASLPPPVPHPRLSVDRDNQIRLSRSLGLRPDRPAVALMPGAEFGPAKCWPLAHFAETARTLVGGGYQVWVLGSAKEREVGAAVIRSAGESAFNLCGKTGLEDVVDLLALARHAISNDSGLLHVAAAAGCNVIGIYGSSTPDYTPPLSDRAAVLYLNLECSPCFRRHCPLGHLRCLREIAPRQALDAVERFESGSLEEPST